MKRDHYWENTPATGRADQYLGSIDKRKIQAWSTRIRQARPSKEVMSKMHIGGTRSNSKMLSLKAKLSGSFFHPLLFCMLTMFFGIITHPPTPALARDVTVGGWGGFIYTDSDKAGSKRGFDVCCWYLNFSAEPAEGFRFFGEFETEHSLKFEAGEEGDGEIELERLYIERNFSSAHNLRAGKFFAPLGYWYRLHWHFLTESYSRPISFHNAYAPHLQVGLQYYGRTFLRNTRFSYYAWLGNGPDLHQTDQRTVEDFGRGASIFVTYKIGGAPDKTIGTAFGYHVQTVANTNATGSQKNFLAAFETKMKLIEARSEYYRHDREDGRYIATWYLSITFWLRAKAGISYRIDRGDDIKRTPLASTHETTSHSIGWLWRPHPTVLLKSEYRINAFDDPLYDDYNIWNFFVAIRY